MLYLCVCLCEYVCSDAAIDIVVVATCVAATAAIAAGATTSVIAIVVALDFVAAAAAAAAAVAHAPIWCVCMYVRAKASLNQLNSEARQFNGSSSITPSLTLSCNLSLPPSLSVSLPRSKSKHRLPAEKLQMARAGSRL